MKKLLPLIVLLTGCASVPDSVLSPSGSTPPEWSASDLEKGIAVQLVRKTEHASHHFIRLADSESLHLHEHSDLTVTVLSGKVRMHLADRVEIVHPGQVIDIPKGTPHFAENISGRASEAYAIFSPPFHPDDYKALHSPSGLK